MKVDHTNHALFPLFCCTTVVINLLTEVIRPLTTEQAWAEIEYNVHLLQALEQPAQAYIGYYMQITQQYLLDKSIPSTHYQSLRRLLIKDRLMEILKDEHHGHATVVRSIVLNII